MRGALAALVLGALASCTAAPPPVRAQGTVAEAGHVATDVPLRAYLSRWAHGPRYGSSQFPVGVWMQDPVRTARGYHDLGVNTFVGLWAWPSDAQAYPGWAASALTALSRYGLQALAAGSPEGVAARRRLPSGDAVVGDVAGDEPDGRGVPLAEWQRDVRALQGQDRPVYANFTKGFVPGTWTWRALGDAGRRALCAGVDLPSVDSYAYTDTYEPPEHRGAYWYGRAVDGLASGCPGRPTFLFVETTQPNARSAVRITPQQFDSAVWTGIAHGADGIILFSHDFYAPDGAGDAALLTDPAARPVRDQVRRTVAALDRLAPVLALPDTPVEVSGPAHALGKPGHVVAVGDGDPQHPGGRTGLARFSVPGGGSGTVAVRGEGRTLPLHDGVFEDRFTPYQHHVYDLPIT